MRYLFLGVAIVSEVVATTCLKQSEGFSKLVPSIITIAGYATAFFFLSLTLKELPTGLVYAVWSGVGIVLISAVAWVVHGQKLDAPGIAGMALIIAGVVLMNVFSKTSAH